MPYDKPTSKTKTMKKPSGKKKKAPKGFHYMPDGSLMKGASHRKKGKPK